MFQKEVSARLGVLDFVTPTSDLLPLSYQVSSDASSSVASAAGEERVAHVLQRGRSLLAEL